MAKEKEFISTTELAEILGISRIAVFKKIQKGEIKARKVGRNYIIDRDEVSSILGRELSDDDKKLIEKAVKKTITEYGETLKLLGKE